MQIITSCCPTTQQQPPLHANVSGKDLVCQTADIPTTKHTFSYQHRNGHGICCCCCSWKILTFSTAPQLKMTIICPQGCQRSCWSIKNSELLCPQEQRFLILKTHFSPALSLTAEMYVSDCGTLFKPPPVLLQHFILARFCYCGIRHCCQHIMAVAQWASPCVVVEH